MTKNLHPLPSLPAREGWMSIWKWLRGSAVREKGAHLGSKPDIGTVRVPTVRFDSSRVTDVVREDLRRNIDAIAEFDGLDRDRIYESALTTIKVGRDVGTLARFLIGLNAPKLPKTTATQIATNIHNKATAKITQQQQLSLGLKHAVWSWSRVDCCIDPRSPTDREKRQMAAHQKADGKLYQIEKGMYLNGRRTLPGYEDGCKCISRSVIPGLPR